MTEIETKKVLRHMFRHPAARVVLEKMVDAAGLLSDMSFSALCTWGSEQVYSDALKVEIENRLIPVRVCALQSAAYDTDVMNREYEENVNFSDELMPRIYPQRLALVGYLADLYGGLYGYHSALGYATYVSEWGDCIIVRERENIIDTYGNPAGDELRLVYREIVPLDEIHEMMWTFDRITKWLPAEFGSVWD